MESESRVRPFTRIEAYAIKFCWNVGEVSYAALHDMTEAELSDLDMTVFLWNQSGQRVIPSIDAALKRVEKKASARLAEIRNR